VTLGRQPAYWLFLALMAGGVLIVGVEQMAYVSTYPGAWLLSILLLAITAIPAGVIIYRFDIFEPEPASLIAVAVMWGGVVALSFSAITNSSMLSFLQHVLPAETVESWGAAIVAPVNEEFYKGAGLVLLFLMARSEIDGLMASTHLLPQLLAAGLSGMTIDQPGWLEGRKLAGRSFAKVTDPTVSAESAAALASAAVNNRTNVVRVVDTLVARLLEMRAEIEAQDLKALEKRFTVARQGRMNWWKERWNANWAAKEQGGSETPTAGEWMGRLVTGYHPKGKKK